MTIKPRPNRNKIDVEFAVLDDLCSVWREPAVSEGLHRDAALATLQNKGYVTITEPFEPTERGIRYRLKKVIRRYYDEPTFHPTHTNAFRWHAAILAATAGGSAAHKKLRGEMLDTINSLIGTTEILPRVTNLRTDDEIVEFGKRMKFPAIGAV